MAKVNTALYDVVSQVENTSSGYGQVRAFDVPTSRGAPDACAARITVKTGAAVVSYDGNDPTSGHGEILPVGGPYFIPYAENMRICGDGAATDVRVVWLK